MQKKVSFIVVLFLSIFSFFSFAGGGGSQDSEGIYNPVPTIMHHIADAHEWHLWGEGDNSFSIPLPVILYSEKGIDIFFETLEVFRHATSQTVPSHTGRICV